MIGETVLYISTLIFCSDVFSQPHSIRRNIILVFLDYIELNFDFATIYLIAGCLCYKDYPVTQALDAIYFSFVSSITIGYGDITVFTDAGKRLLILHSLVFLIFGVVFINFYISKIGQVKKDSTQ